MLPAPILRLSLPLALAILLIVPSPARADCTTPAGVAGKIIFNTTYNVMQYCNGINWINMGGVASNSTAAGSSGAIQFNTGNLLDGEAALTWDKTNDRFGIGTATPSTTLDVVGTASVSGAVTLGSTLTGVTGIGIGTSSVNSKAVLDVVSTTKGFLPPRMTTAQRDAISSPATGLTIYNTTSNALNYFNGTGWQDAGGSYVETDPQVGTLTAGNFCLANGGGTAIDCTTAAIAISSISATGTPSSSTFLRGDGSWASPGSGVSGGSAGYAAVFSSATALTTDSALYVDTTNHRLGIGTTSPGDKVHVYTGGNAGLTIQGTSATNGPWLKLDNSGASGRPWYILSAGSGNGGGTAPLEI